MLGIKKNFRGKCGEKRKVRQKELNCGVHPQYLCSSKQDVNTSDGSKYISFATVNTKSIRNKAEEFMVHIQPSSLGDTYWVPPAAPLFLEGAHPCALAVDSGFLVDFCFSSFSMEGIKPPSTGGKGPLLVGGSILHQTGRQALSFLLTRGLLTHFTPPLFCLALPTMTQFCEWLHSSWRFTICQQQQVLIFPLP